MNHLSHLSRARPEPLYHQLEAALRDRIMSGEWGHGIQIPTEAQLCKAYNVSRVTVRQAVLKLVEQGYLERDRGRGTFVREPTLIAGVRGLRSFSEEMEALSLRPGARVLRMRLAPASSQVAEQLEIAVEAPVVEIRRLRTGDDQPIGIQTSCLPAARFPDLEQINLADQSLYECLRRSYGVRSIEARETFRVTKITAEDAKLLQTRGGACAFWVERLAFDPPGPFEYTTSIMRGDRYRIQWVLREVNKPDPEDDNLPYSLSDKER